ncbi:MAG: YchJ family metal-binding protein [Variovorax sp.]
MTSSADTPCPCGRTDQRARPLAFSRCCGAYLDAESVTHAPDPESLMRSRYSAFVEQRVDYLLATWHPSTRPAQLTLEEGVRWLGLEVRSRSMQDGEHGEVEFVARQRDASGRASRLHERSRFVREGESDETARWFYLGAAP